MARTVVVTQSNYLPWRGWFDMVRRADVLVVLDTVQYTRRDWRNRNRIKTAGGSSWITIPVEAKGRYDQAIDATRISSPDWAEDHLRAISNAYREAAHVKAVLPWLADRLREVAPEPLLTEVNVALARAVLARLGLEREILRDRDLLDRADLTAMGPSERLAALAQAAGATTYLSGPAAKAYMDEAPFARRGIEPSWMDYGGYCEYPQPWGAFEPGVSIIDLLLNTGEDAPRLLSRGAVAAA